MSDLCNPIPGFGLPPSLDDIARMAERAMTTIPPGLAHHVHNIAIAVHDRADPDTLDALGIESVWELTGLYHGTPLTERSVMDVARQPEMIFLYREPILLEWIETGEDLYRLVRSVVIHEVAHHFGFSDADIAAIEQGLEQD